MGRVRYLLALFGWSVDSWRGAWKRAGANVVITLMATRPFCSIQELFKGGVKKVCEGETCSRWYDNKVIRYELA